MCIEKAKWLIQTKDKYNRNFWYLEFNWTNILLGEMSIWWSCQKTSLASPSSCSPSIAFLEHLRSMLLIWNILICYLIKSTTFTRTAKIWRYIFNIEISACHSRQFIYFRRKIRQSFFLLKFILIILFNFINFINFI